MRSLGKGGTLQFEQRLQVSRHVVGFHRFDHVRHSDEGMLAATRAAIAEQVH
jgi:hypothetical protein